MRTSKTGNEKPFLIIESDPNYKKPRKKVIPVAKGGTGMKTKKKHNYKPLLGFLCSPYIVVRPGIRKATRTGEKLYSKVFEEGKVS